MQRPAPVGHSAKVRLSLRVNGHVMPLSQIGADFCIARSPIDLAPQSGEIVTEIDGNLHVHPVYLSSGMSSESPRTAVQDLFTATFSAG